MDQLIHSVDRVEQGHQQRRRVLLHSVGTEDMESNSAQLAWLLHGDYSPNAPSADKEGSAVIALSLDATH